MAKAYKYLALGDSYTIGEGVEEENTFPYQLADQLEKEFEISVVARTGWTTGELLAAIDQEQISGTFDLVTLLIGVNNQYRGYSQDVYRKEFAELLQTAIKFAGGNKNRVAVLSIPDWGVTPFARNENRDPQQVALEIDYFNAINKEETEREGVAYVDITPVSRQALHDATLLAADGLHPAGKMYFLWGQQILSSIGRFII